MAVSKDEIIEALKEMPALELSELVKELEEVFGVTVTGVNTINRQGKRVRTRGGHGRRPNTKRAIVSLAPGERIDIFGESV